MILIPPNLARLGVVRRTPGYVPDLITIWRTPYPVLTKYKLLCDDMDVKPFAGGIYAKQGLRGRVGYVTSGYRVDGSSNSPHKFALALDIAVGNLGEQIKWARQAVRYFCRVGLYPQNGFIHIDLCDDAWQQKFAGKPSWVRIDRTYTSFCSIEESIEFAREEIQDDEGGTV